MCKICGAKFGGKIKTSVCVGIVIWMIRCSARVPLPVAPYHYRSSVCSRDFLEFRKSSCLATPHRPLLLPFIFCYSYSPSDAGSGPDEISISELPSECPAGDAASLASSRICVIWRATVATVSSSSKSEK